MQKLKKYLFVIKQIRTEKQNLKRINRKINSLNDFIEQALDISEKLTTNNVSNEISKSALMLSAEIVKYLVFKKIDLYDDTERKLASLYIKRNRLKKELKENLAR